jgi:outer membrane receptor for monomeric catechols
VSGYARLDGVLSYRRGAMATWLKVENLSDARYVRSGVSRDSVYQGAPRNAMLSVQASFL